MIPHAAGSTILSAAGSLQRRREAEPLDVVIYEEDYFTRALLSQWLGEAGYRVNIGSTRTPEPPCRADLVIVNVYMPKQAGAQCIRGLRAAHPNTPFIAISAQFRSGLAACGATAHALGVDQVIAKPLARTNLLEAVRAMIGVPD
jgi:DNA-binding response OmpR family regulator